MSLMSKCMIRQIISQKCAHVILFVFCFFVFVFMPVFVLISFLAQCCLPQNIEEENPIHYDKRSLPRQPLPYGKALQSFFYPDRKGTGSFMAASSNQERKKIRASEAKSNTSGHSGMPICSKLLLSYDRPQGASREP